MITGIEFHISLRIGKSKNIMFWKLIVSIDYNIDHNNKDLINGNKKFGKSADKAKNTLF